MRVSPPIGCDTSAAGPPEAYEGLGQTGGINAIQFPRTIDEITPEWLTSTLRERDVITSSKVESVAITNIGDGRGFIGEVNRVDLVYDRRENGAPRSLIAKLALADDEKRKLFDSFGFYERETRFYQELSSASGMATPALYFAEYDADSGYVILLLEDLSHLRTVDEVDDCSFEDASAALRSLAMMHAKWWEDERLAELTWLINPADPSRLRQGEETVARNLEPFLEMAGDHLPPGLEAIARKLGPKLADVRLATARGPITLNHGDFKLGNLFFDDAGNAANQVIAYDWQLASRSRAAADVAMFTMRSLAVESRRAHENRLMTEYHADLMDRSVKGYSYDEFLTDVRLALLSKLAIDADGMVNWRERLLSTDEGRKRIAAVCERTQMLVDWNCDEAIPR